MESTLYLELSTPAPSGTPGRTPGTQTKETIDNDVESLLLELLAVPTESSSPS